MIEIISQARLSAARRRFLKQGIGWGLSSCLAGCGGRRVASGAVGSTDPTPTTPTTPVTPTPPQPPQPPALPNPQPTPSGALTAATATVSSVEIAPVDGAFCGLSFEKSELVSRVFATPDVNMINLFKALGASIMRIGGSAVDKVIWTPDGKGRQGKQISKIDLNNFAAFVKQTGWQVIYGINLAQGTETAAAEEAAYAAQVLGDKLYCFELGNEPNSYKLDGYTPPAGTTWSYTTFRDKWVLLRNAILQAAPNATFAGPDATDGNIAAYTVPFAADMGSNLKLLSQHYYRIGDTTPATLSLLLSAPDTTLVTKLATVKGAADKAGVPYRLTETSSVTSGGAVGVSDVYGSALWALDHLLTSAVAGASGVHFHGGSAANYTPFTFGSDQVTAVRPEYYGLLFFTMMGQGKVLASTINAGGLNISAYSIKTSAGISTLFINKEASQSFRVALQYPGSFSKITAIHLTAPGLSSTTGIQIQGAAISLDFGLGAMNAPYDLYGGQQTNVNVPAMTAVLVKAS